MNHLVRIILERLLYRYRSGRCKKTFQIIDYKNY